ncbi:hypothetical protein HA466_0127280 [Hirschfeldia incana]|nr:hypothetical protein HA466_0127280 [Hirschfeldia incana]
METEVEAIGYPSASGAGHELQRQVIDEIEIRELRIDHIDHRRCWGSRPTRTWKICAVEDCNVYVGTQTVPFTGGNFNGKKHGSAPELWQLDLRSQFPTLFFPYKETRLPVPHFETVDKCIGNTYIYVYS